ncbi:MAG: translocation/assembly module TamB domain-containing protein, partial [Bacteroidales bacterium]|nr:translocation/assembly module TamB domain-containing protein [Bacteroidales bacterium]
QFYGNGIYNFSLQTLKTMSLLEVAYPGLYIEDGTNLNVFIDRDDNLTGSLLSGRLAMKSNYFKGVDLSLNSAANEKTDVKLFSDEVHLAGITMDSTCVDLSMAQNILEAGFKFKNDSTENNSAHILANVKFDSRTSALVNLLSGSDISLEGEKWKFTPSEISISDSAIVVENFNIVNEDQKFSLDGNISKYSSDILNFGLNNFNVGIFNLFLRRSFDVQGHFSGSGILSDLYRAPKIFLNIDGTDVSVYGNKVGTMKMMSKWNDLDKELNLFIKSSLDDKITLNANGFYRPEDSYLSLHASLEDLSVGYFEPFLSDIISRSSGSMSGELNLTGPLNKLKLTGENCHFSNLNFKVNFTGVPYTVNGPFDLNERGIFFTNLPVTDQFGSKGFMNGKFGYNYFRDLHLDTKVTFTNFQCLDTDEKDNEYFYGDAFATGSVHLKGPLEKIHIDIDVVSNKNTSIHIPLMNSATASQTNLLTFVEPYVVLKVDAYDSLQTINSDKVSKSN